MEFCSKCGGLVVEKLKNSQCLRCGASVKGIVKVKSSEKLEKTQEVGVVKEKEIDVFPITSADCKKCGHKEAYFWSSQTRSGDEAETRFFKCTKCKHTWREYR
ncbi:transcription factor S [Candidatus Pacearchaeota archaeon CG10_big_fil_rev_8_21_14_0_10_35_13]|nr:MAG: transcription factor S [Candidatus Pacearchaeota archaeon CG10_big_fil_rev_8_21_14_0_10_35_13]